MHADRQALLSLFYCVGKSGGGETEFAVCQFDAGIFIFNIKSSVQSSHGSSLLDTGLQLLWNIELAWPGEGPKGWTNTCFGFVTPNSCTAYWKATFGSNCSLSSNKSQSCAGRNTNGFHHSQLWQKLCSLAWLPRALQAVSLSLNTNSVLALCLFWTWCPHYFFKYFIMEQQWRSCSISSLTNHWSNYLPFYFISNLQSRYCFCDRNRFSDDFRSS